ncbi:adenylate kinase [Agrococcus sp. SGAir0287]|uniref:adenylate kinase n=1 Tax=Agrococcus sp. SGAir0287 TaxID=2070347 RepID=UPI0010CD15B9|nr:adenylate kinase [Agrococcus sp. SGAir0287]QCR20059.1 adenylate kinase [Agrococcus sp. SGAir0287]
MTQLLIVGPPGAGKGTQASRIAERFGIPTISTGDIFRWNIKERTPLGAQVTAILDAGDYVPDSLTNDLVEDRLGQADAQEGYLLDGYPRTEGQVAFLDELNERRGRGIDAVVRLVADHDEVIRRLQLRAAEQGRSDDTDEAMRHRLEVYERETEPILALYAARGIVVEIDGLGEIDEVTGRILDALSTRGVAAR